MIRRGIGVQSFVSAGVSNDADAQAFIDAAGITDATQQSAINTLVTDLKGYGIWSKMKAIYPFVGGTSSTHKWNLKDPRDLDAAFRLVFSGGWTHSSTGALPNGTNGYADTKLNCLNNLSQNSTHFSFYSRTNSNGTEIELGARQSTSTGRSNLLEIRTSGITYVQVSQNGTSNLLTFSDTNSAAFYIGNRTASNLQNAWKNSNKLATDTTTSSAIQPNLNIFLSAFNEGGTALYFSTKQCAFASIGDGLTDTEAANLYTAVQAYQTTLSRQIAP